MFSRIESCSEPFCNVWLCWKSDKTRPASYWKLNSYFKFQDSKWKVPSLSLSVGCLHLPVCAIEGPVHSPVLSCIINYKSSTSGNAIILFTCWAYSYDVTWNQIFMISFMFYYRASTFHFIQKVEGGNTREKFPTHLMWDCRVNPKIVWKVSSKVYACSCIFF